MSELDLTPGSPEWCRRVSPSKVAACMGLSPWDSQRSMYHKMRGEVPWDEETPAMERGTLCEPAVLAWWRKHHEHDGWTDQPSATVGDWCVATPDALTTMDGLPTIVEAKTSAEDDAWGTPGTDEVPVYYLTQALFAAHVLRLNGTDAQQIHMPVLFGRRLRFENYVIGYNAELAESLFARMEQWRDDLAADVAPELDDTIATWDAVRKVHPDIDRGESIELDEKTARAVVEWTDELKSTKAAQRLATSTVLDRMGRAQYATHNGVRIARRQKGSHGVSFVVVAKPSDLPDRKESAA